MDTRVQATTGPLGTGGTLGDERHVLEDLPNETSAKPPDENGVGHLKKRIEESAALVVGCPSDRYRNLARMNRCLERKVKIEVRPAGA